MWRQNTKNKASVYSACTHLNYTDWLIFPTSFSFIDDWIEGKSIHIRTGAPAEDEELQPGLWGQSRPLAEEDSWTKPWDCLVNEGQKEGW